MKKNIRHISLITILICSLLMAGLISGGCGKSDNTGADHNTSANAATDISAQSDGSTQSDGSAQSDVVTQEDTSAQSDANNKKDSDNDINDTNQFDADQSSVPELRDVKTEKDEKYGSINIMADMDDLSENGFALGDSVDVEFSNGFMMKDVPIYNGYYVAPGDMLLMVKKSSDATRAAINYGDSLWVISGLSACCLRHLQGSPMMRLSKIICNPMLTIMGFQRRMMLKGGRS